MASPQRTRSAPPSSSTLVRRARNEEGAEGASAQPLQEDCAWEEMHSNFSIWSCLTSFHPVGVQPSAGCHVCRRWWFCYSLAQRCSQLASVGVQVFVLQICIEITTFFRYIDWEKRKNWVTWDWRNLKRAATVNNSTSSRFVHSKIFAFPYCDKYIYQI